MNDLVAYSNQLRLKNMDFRARETKLVARIKQLEEQVSVLKASEKAFEKHRHRSSQLIHQLE